MPHDSKESEDYFGSNESYGQQECKRKLLQMQSKVTEIENKLDRKERHMEERIIELQVKKLYSDANITRGSEHAAGYDLYCMDDVSILPGIPTKVQTGIAMAIPQGYYGLLRDRSSIGSKGVIISAGVIDSDYRGEILVCFNNLCFTTYHFKKGEKIAQIVIMPCLTVPIVEVDTLSDTQRGEGGFGSTGR